MGISKQVLEDVLYGVSLLETKGDGVIIETLKIPREIFQQDGNECRKYKRNIERQVLTHPAVHSVFVLWTAHGDCYLELAV